MGRPENRPEDWNLQKKRKNEVEKFYVCVKTKIVTECCWIMANDGQRWPKTWSSEWLIVAAWKPAKTIEKWF